MDTRTIRARVPPDEIGYVNALVDAYEGLAQMRTRNSDRGIVEFWVAPDIFDEFRQILHDLSTEVPLEIED